MKMPGEKLLLALWETLAKNAVGGLLTPMQIRRVELAQIEMRAHETVTLADAEREAEEIKAGRLTIDESRHAKVTALPAPRFRPRQLEGLAHLQPAMRVAASSMIDDALRREVNVAKAIQHAEEELRDDQQAPPDAKIDPDWLYRWRDYAGAVSSEELQSLWGKVLAGELKSPQSVSYRTLELIRNMSSDDAQLITKLAPFVITKMIVSNDKIEAILQNAGLFFGGMLELQELGVITGVGSIGLGMELKSNRSDRFENILWSHQRLLRVRHDDPAISLNLSGYLVTAVGIQVLALVQAEPNEDYLVQVAEGLKAVGATVSMFHFHKVAGGKVQPFNEIVL